MVVRGHWWSVGARGGAGGPEREVAGCGGTGGSSLLVTCLVRLLLFYYGCFISGVIG